MACVHVSWRRSFRSRKPRGSNHQMTAPHLIKRRRALLLSAAFDNAAASRAEPLHVGPEAIRNRIITLILHSAAMPLRIGATSSLLFRSAHVALLR